MEYTTLGRTGVEVSRIGFGGAVLGLTDYIESFDPEDARDRARALESIEAALQVGINYFDTAPGYGDGTSERILGEGLRGVETSGGRPLFIATKVGLGDLGDVRVSLEQSLERLGRPRIDLLQVHGGSYDTATTDRVLGETVPQLLECKRAGLVGHIGFTSEDNNDSLYRLIRSGAFDAMQICYNLLNQHPYEPSRPFGSLLVAREHGLGTLTMRTTTSGTFQHWIRLVNPADTFDYSAALIQFVLSCPEVDVALVGIRTPEIARAAGAIADDRAGRIDLRRLHERYV